MCATYVFRLILYRLSVLIQSKDQRRGLKQSLSELLWRWFVDRSVINIFVMEAWECWIWRAIGWLKIGFPGSILDERYSVGTEAESCRRPRGEALFFTECHKVLRNLPGSRNELYQDLVVGALPQISSSCLEETALHAYYCKRARPLWSHVEEWTARIDSKQCRTTLVTSKILR